MLIDRMWRAAMLQSSVYEEVEADQGATSQAALVVLIVAIAAVLGEFLSETLFGTRTGVAGLARGIVTGLFGDFVSGSSGPTWPTSLARGCSAARPRQASCCGRSGSPVRRGSFSSLASCRCGGLISFVVLIWLILTSVVAIRQALDFSTGKALGTAIISLIPACWSRWRPTPSARRSFAP